MKYYITKTSFGFTLIELLVVVSIIGMLASVVLASLSDARNSAQYAAVKQEMRLIEQSLVIAGGAGQPIGEVTGSWCTMCTCRDRYGGGSDLRTVDDSSSSGSQSCIQRWEDALEAIAGQSVMLSDVEGLKRDPWGSPYLLDENELEPDYTPCRVDWLRSAGADGIMSTPDDYVIQLPFRSGQCPN